MIQNQNRLSFRSVYSSIFLFMILGALKLVLSKSAATISNSEFTQYALDPNRATSGQRVKRATSSPANYEYHYNRDEYEFFNKKQPTTTASKFFGLSKSDGSELAIPLEIDALLAMKSLTVEEYTKLMAVLEIEKKKFSSERYKFMMDVNENNVDMTKADLTLAEIKFLHFYNLIAKAFKQMGPSTLPPATNWRALNVPSSKIQPASSSAFMLWLASARFKLLVSSIDICLTGIICLIGKFSLCLFHFF
jgi:hypothetical protein